MVTIYRLRYQLLASGLAIAVGIRMMLTETLVDAGFRLVVLTITLMASSYAFEIQSQFRRMDSPEDWDEVRSKILENARASKNSAPLPQREAELRTR